MKSSDFYSQLVLQLNQLNKYFYFGDCIIQFSLILWNASDSFFEKDIVFVKSFYFYFFQKYV